MHWRRLDMKNGLKQLFRRFYPLIPQKFHTKYRLDGKQYKSTWWQWFGCCWNIHHTQLDAPN